MDHKAAPRIIGRSSSHFTRTVRVFAHELDVAYEFVPVFDLSVQSAAGFAGNPALKVPVLETEQGAWFGALNICRELARSSPSTHHIVWPEHLPARLASNAQELVLHGMATEVALIMHGALEPGQGGPSEQKARASLVGCLEWLESELASVVDQLPPGRTLSFLEVSAFCFVTHLSFRKVLATTPYPKLERLCRSFATRDSARLTSYRYDAV
jgi:glutathione S-transferase